MEGDNYDIILAEELEIDNVEQLRMRERYYSVSPLHGTEVAFLDQEGFGNLY